MSDNLEIIVGIVEDGKFIALTPKADLSKEVRLTSISMPQAVPPETGEIKLGEYEGSVIAIRGHDSGGWIYEASVIDMGGPIVTALARRVLDLDSRE